MPFKYKNLLILSTVLLGCVLFTGCGPDHKPRIVTGQSRPSYTVSVNELASKLGLSVRKAGSPYFELGDAKNTVRLFMYEGGRIYVNGKPVGSIDHVTERAGQYYVPELLVPTIRRDLIPANLVPLPGYKPYEAPRSFGTGTVVIDPGHGGSDPGAPSYLGYWEKDINLKIAHKLVYYLRQEGIKVVMTRDNDRSIPLDDRVALTNRVNPDLFVSIHNNTNHTRNTRGYMILIARNASEASKQAGRTIERTMETTGLKSMGMRKDSRGLRVLKNTKCPAVLVECGHISNPNEAALLYDGQFQNRIARAIADGILKYL